MATFLARFSILSLKRDITKPFIYGCRHCSTIENKDEAYTSIYSRDPAPYFFKEEVQKILKQVTGLDLQKVYRRRYSKPAEPKYKFLTDAELVEMQERIVRKVDSKLQIPPVLREREPIKNVLSYEPRLQGFDKCKFVFTDVSMGVKNKDRLIVVREPDGTLRSAYWDERQRMNQMFFPIEGRRITTPRMFQDEYLQKALDQNEHEFILDRATIQFEPDDPDYVTVTSTVYTHISKTQQFKLLHSTRHFGAMAFYLAFQKILDYLIIYMIEQERIDDASELVRLFQMLHPESKTARTLTDFTDKAAAVKAYAHLDGSKSSNLVLIIEKYVQLEQQKKEIEADIKQSHGYTS